MFGTQSTQQQGGGGGGGGLFGSQSTQQTGGGLFGSSTQQSQPQQSGGLFGSTLGQNQQQQQQPQQQSQGGGLFGGLNSQNKPSLFGSSTNQPQQQTSSLFSQSQSQQQQQQQKPSLFGQSTQQQPQQQQQQQQSVPGVQIDISQLRGTTRFNDLHETLQKQIETIDTFIQQQMTYKDQCAALMPKHGETLSYIPNDVEFITRRLETAQHALENDAQAVDRVRKLIRKDAADAKLSFSAIDNLKLPHQYHYTGLWNDPTAVPSGSQSSASKGAAAVGVSGSRAGDPSSSSAGPGSGAAGTNDNDNDDEEKDSTTTSLLSYFTRTAAEMSQTLAHYRGNLQEIESHLRGVEASTMQQMQQLLFTRQRDENGGFSGSGGGARSAEDQVRELAAVLREFENGILAVAGKVGGVREGVQELALGGGVPGHGQAQQSWRR
ncbi:MAG: hypothetical protein M1819_001385 [Sarea resinae]|nr:MAG: hypothetical protein M1819_001385 [Sarea resinae]